MLELIHWLIGLTLNLLPLLVLGFLLYFSFCPEQPYVIAKQSLRNNETLIRKIGTVKGFGLAPVLFYENDYFDSIGKRGFAEYNLIIRCQKKFVEVQVSLELHADTLWHVKSIMLNP